MFPNLKRGGAVGLICIALGSTSNRAAAVTVEVARKCKALTEHSLSSARAGKPRRGECEGKRASGARLFQQVCGERQQGG